MTTILTDSLAREHVESMLTAAATSRQARAARLSARTHRTSGAGHAVARPFRVVRHWLLAGEL